MTNFYYICKTENKLDLSFRFHFLHLQDIELYVQYFIRLLYIPFLVYYMPRYVIISSYILRTFVCDAILDVVTLLCGIQMIAHHVLFIGLLKE